MAIYRSCVIISLSASITAALTNCFLSLALILLIRCFAIFDSFTLSPHALVTTLAVKFRAIGILTIETNASTLIGFDAGTAPAS